MGRELSKLGGSRISRKVYQDRRDVSTKKFKEFSLPGFHPGHRAVAGSRIVLLGATMLEHAAPGT